MTISQKKISSVYEKNKDVSEMNCFYMLNENKVYWKLQIKIKVLTCYNPTLQRGSKSENYISQL